MGLGENQEPRCWGYAARADGGQQGYCCYYCMVVFQSRYKHRVKTRNDLITLIGSNQEEHQKFTGYIAALISYFIQHGGRGVTVRWADVDKKQVSLLTTTTVSVQERPDDLWDYEDPSPQNLFDRVTFHMGLCFLLIFFK